MYQEPTVFPDLTVAENIFAGPPPARRARHRSTGARCAAEARRLLDELGVDFAPDTPVRGLGVADRQLLEIAKALSSSARVLIMDEPTAALSPHEVDNLFAIVRRLRDRGVAIVFISHRLEEVERDRRPVTVLRDGRHVATRPAARALARRDRPADGRPLARRALPQGGGRDRRRRPRACEGFTRRGVFCGRLVRAAARRDRRPRRPRRRRPDRGRAQPLRDRPARRGRARGSTGRRSGPRSPRAALCAAGSRTCPRTGSARGSSSRCRSRRTRRWRSCPS